MRGSVLAKRLVKCHLKISADIMQIYIERTSWLPRAVPLGLDRSLQGHNHLGRLKKICIYVEEGGGCSRSCNPSPGDGPLLQALFTAEFH